MIAQEILAVIEKNMLHFNVHQPAGLTRSIVVLARRIGKSTFLMTIDFAFGGRDYTQSWRWGYWRGWMKA
jgi:hypothetical protein